VEGGRAGASRAGSRGAHIRDGDIDPSFVITHRMSLDDAPRGYRTFLEKADGCEKVVLAP